MAWFVIAGFCYIIVIVFVVVIFFLLNLPFLFWLLRQGHRTQAGLTLTTYLKMTF